VRWKFFNTKDEAKEFSVDNFILSGNVREINGKWGRAYAKSGEFAVKSIERAAEILGCPFGITGDYLIGTNWGECH
jgi:hypothetical protein